MARLVLSDFFVKKKKKKKKTKKKKQTEKQCLEFDILVAWLSGTFLQTLPKLHSYATEEVPFISAQRHLIKLWKQHSFRALEHARKHEARPPPVNKKLPSRSR